MSFEGVVLPGGTRGLQILEALESARPGMAAQVTLSERPTEIGYELECAWVDGPQRSEVVSVLGAHLARLREGGEEIVAELDRVLLLRTLSLTGVVAAILGGAPACMLVHSPALTRSEHADMAIEEHLAEARRLLEVAIALDPGGVPYQHVVRRHAELLRFDHIPDATRLWLRREGLALAASVLVELE